MGNVLLKCVSIFKKNEALNISDMKLSLPKGLKIRDQREIFMLKFPFYQMEVIHFKHLILSLPSKVYTTESELYELFKEIEEINQSWLRVHTLLKAKVFRFTQDEDDIDRSQYSS